MVLVLGVYRSDGRGGHGALELLAAGIALVVGIVQAAKADPKGAELPKMKL